ncbi:MAG: hypothetical protein QXL94_07580 [Candidatus Parvarchaeum sp.]
MEIHNINEFLIALEEELDERVTYYADYLRKSFCVWNSGDKLFANCKFYVDDYFWDFIFAIDFDKTEDKWEFKKINGNQIYFEIHSKNNAINISLAKDMAEFLNDFLAKNDSC